MFSRVFLISVFSWLDLSNAAQTVFDVRIQNLPQPGIQMIVEYFEEDGWKNITNIKPQPGNRFSTTINFDHSGQYRMRLSNDPKRWADFIVVKEKIPSGGFQLDLSYEAFSAKPLNINGSDEDLAYAALAGMFNEVTLNPDSLKRNSEELITKEMQFANRCEQVAKTYPGTFTAQVLTRILPLPIPPANFPKDSLYHFQYSHAFDFWQLNRPGVKNHIGMIRRLNIGFNYFQDNGMEEKYIDVLMKKALVSEEMTAWMFKFLLEKMIDHKNERALSYLITWYSNDCAESDHLESSTKNLLAALEKCKPGNTIEYLNLPDLKGKLISSQQVISANKLTIIMFWKGTCAHCREFYPELRKIYDKYAQQGVAIYGIGTDKDEADWRNQANANNSPWNDVYLSYENRRDFSKRFPVSGTPTFMAVDRNGTILKRMMIRSKLDEEINALLLEMK
jgi:thiol-disulfide isomerase/thioredoxin